MKSFNSREKFQLLRKFSTQKEITNLKGTYQLKTKLSAEEKNVSERKSINQYFYIKSFIDKYIFFKVSSIETTHIKLSFLCKQL